MRDLVHHDVVLKIFVNNDPEIVRLVNITNMNQSPSCKSCLGLSMLWHILILSKDLIVKNHFHKNTNRTWLEKGLNHGPTILITTQKYFTCHFFLLIPVDELVYILQLHQLSSSIFLQQKNDFRHFHNVIFDSTEESPFQHCFSFYWSLNHWISSVWWCVKYLSRSRDVQTLSTVGLTHHLVTLES